MSKVRILGPLLMIVLGAVMAFVPVGDTFAGALSQVPCADGASTGAGVKAAQIQCCDFAVGGIAVCPTVPITDPPGTETTVTPTTEPPTTAPATTTQPETTTTVGASTTAMATTTASGGVQSGGASRPASTALARTGTGSTAPLTAAGITLMVLGAGLLIVGRRRSELGA